jgi:hypothetical protein
MGHTAQPARLGGRMNGLPQVWEIYIVTCAATGKQYVGQASRTAYARWGWTISHALSGRKDFPLHRAIRQHGPHNFAVEVIAASKSQVDADWLERELIEQRNTRVPHGYNVTGGRGALGTKLTEAQRANRSAQSKAHWADPLQRATHTAALRASGPSRGAKIKAAYAAPELKAKNRTQLDVARDKRLTGVGVRTKRTIRDRRQPDML